MKRSATRRPIALAVWGEKDNLIPQEQADLLVGSVRRGRNVVILGGSHDPN